MNWMLTGDDDVGEVGAGDEACVAAAGMVAASAVGRQRSDDGPFADVLPETKKKITRQSEIEETNLPKRNPKLKEEINGGPGRRG